jgi:hypothetical protein
MTDMGDESSEMGIGRFGRMENRWRRRYLQQKCVISNPKWVIGRFGRMETDEEEEEEDNATEMCNKQSEMGIGRFGKKSRNLD